MSPADSLAFFLPELALATAILAVLLVDLVPAVRARGGREWPGTLALLGAAAALVLTAGLPVLRIRGLLEAAPVPLFGRMLVLDPFAVFFKLLLLLALLAAVWMALRSREVHGRPHEAEFHALLLGSGLGMLLMASAANLLMAYLALELVSLCAYALTGFLRHDRRGGEAALKYLLYGGVASGTMIYGMSLLFGLAGTMDYHGIGEALGALGPDAQGVLFVALLLVLVGFGYKIAAVPFHMWAPDAYTGAPLPVSALLAVGSKAAGFALLLRFFAFAVGADGPAASVAGIPLVPLVWGVSVATMTLGNLAALAQTNMKRLLAYSSVAHAGYALLAVVVFRDTGVRAVLLYLAIYYVMTLGAFWIVMMMRNATGREDLDAYRGLAWRGGGPVAALLAVFLFSLAGLPPLAGFIGKFYVFAAGVQAGLYGLVVAGVLNSVLSLAYYARVVRTMFLDRPGPDDRSLAFPTGDVLAAAALGVATVVLGVRFGWLVDRAEEARRVFAG
ncbi:MAG: NADH-quinone oxidoreductase subunit N [bacterium]|nr:NADH-quinone oxidoreductase subunit N [bacterium]